jgi:hypothetical protein
VAARVAEPGPGGGAPPQSPSSTVPGTSTPPESYTVDTTEGHTVPATSTPPETFTVEYPP